ncbi:hypothetical protein CLAFUW4_13977 [Fulvia fulva]|nr:hypothetical protein CLAFUR4_13980 [Fulvia fulva]KAK4610828.1 hypothetical protein CLAFUR0_13984 [Fulvia fulva]WPV22266.1 hypothetical protein CLAFUW4_13977 [Fulvia fulva]
MSGGREMRHAQQSLRLLPQFPDEITLRTLDNLPATTLLILRQASSRLRRTVDAESPRLCTVLREVEEDRVKAMSQPLDLKNLSIEEALRLRVQRWGKPRSREYWLECRSLASSYNTANRHTARVSFQDNVFEFLLHLDDVFHESAAMGMRHDSEIISRRPRSYEAGAMGR